MRNKLPFFLTLMLSLLAVFIFSVQTNAQWHSDDRYTIERNERLRRQHQERIRQQQERIRRQQKERHAQTIIVRPSTQVYRDDNYNRNDRVYRNDTYYRNDRYDENYNYGSVRQLARLHGYNDGLHEGAKDARDGDRPDPFGEGEYQDADEGYRSRYGSRSEYKQIYRQGFLQGYREAFNRYLGSGERNW